MKQPDLLRDSPQRTAELMRIDAETQRHNPYCPPEWREKRVAYLLAEADRLEKECVR